MNATLPTGEPDEGQPTAVQPIDPMTPTLVITGASGVAIPVENLTSSQLRDLTSEDAIANLSRQIETEALA